jgi:hypothetical protein
MILKVKLIGKGVTGDPLRAALPTYMLIDHDEKAGHAIVNLPDEIHELTAEDLAHEPTAEHPHGTFYPFLCTDCVAKIHKLWDKKYEGHNGKFKLEPIK